MLGKIPLVKGVHVILNKFHNCVMHIRTHGPNRVFQNYNRQPVSPSLAVNVNFRGYLQFLFIRF